MRLKISGCDTNASCTNLYGGYECRCNWMWTGDGKTCDGKISEIIFNDFLLNIFRCE